VEALRAGDVDCLHRIFTLRNMDVVLATYDQLKLHMDKALEVSPSQCEELLAAAFSCVSCICRDLHIAIFGNFGAVLRKDLSSPPFVC
jgi:hypothetical protein